jgi:threonine dehydratase
MEDSDCGKTATQKGHSLGQSTDDSDSADVRKPRNACKVSCSTRPCVESRTLSQLVGAQVFLKFENLQFTASFKERGACNKLSQLAEAPSHRPARRV